MKITLVSLLLLFTFPALAQDVGSVKVTTKKYHRVALGGGCVIDSNYPEVAGRADLNKQIRALLPAPCSPSDVDPGHVIKIEQDFAATYNAKGLLSVFGAGLWTNTKGGQMMSAHPTKIYGGVTLDTKTGKAYSLRDMFGADAYAKLDPILAKGAAKEATEVGDLPDVTGHTYHAYLSKTGVTFYEIFDMFALSSLEVTIPYAEAVKIANPNGPLARFGAK